MTDDQIFALMLQLASGVFLPELLQWLKNKPWFPFMNLQGTSINRWFSWTVALVTALGIGFSFNPTVGSLTVTGLTAMGIKHAIGHMALQLAANHGYYHGVIAPRLPGETQAALRQLLQGGQIPAMALAHAVPPQYYVGDPVAAGSTLYRAKPNDPTLPGTSVTTDAGTFIKRTVEYYEKIA